MFSEADTPNPVTRAELHAELQRLATKEELRDRHIHRRMERLEALCAPKAKAERVRARR